MLLPYRDTDTEDPRYGRNCLAVQHRCGIRGSRNVGSPLIRRPTQMII